MPRFGQRSTTNLQQCHPDIQRVLTEAIKVFDFSVICGERNEEAQTIAFKGGKSKLEWPKSKHNKTPSMAVDICPWPIDWENVSSFKFLAGHILGIAHMMLKDKTITHKFRWGGDWDSDKDMDDQKFNDLPHFELLEIK